MPPNEFASLICYKITIIYDYIICPDRPTAKHRKKQPDFQRFPADLLYSLSYITSPVLFNYYSALHTIQQHKNP